mmetsp:Transcript_99669/g.321350  ORF Transcript_99669/g.321350 Transcript_99669/m.321350 type:complete len:326 (-) Transcript_99669:107-1084(-)
MASQGATPWRSSARATRRWPWQSARSTKGSWPQPPCEGGVACKAPAGIAASSSSQRRRFPRCTAACSSSWWLRDPRLRSAASTRAAPGSSAASRRWPRAASGLAGRPPRSTTSHSAVAQQCQARARSVPLSPSRSFRTFAATPSSSTSRAADCVAPWEQASQRRLAKPPASGMTPKPSSFLASATSSRRRGVSSTPCGASGRAPRRSSFSTSRQSPSSAAARAAMSTRPRLRPRRTSTWCRSPPLSMSSTQAAAKFREAAQTSSGVGAAQGSSRARTSSAQSRGMPRSCSSSAPRSTRRSCAARAASKPGRPGPLGPCCHSQPSQ